MIDADAVVIGAGIIGLACAAELAARGDRVIVIERRARAGQETSARNSGVVHAGLYYPADSLKARLCTAGRRLLYERATRENIRHRRLGKLIVATEADQLPKLQALHAQGQQNGAGTLRILDRREVRALEPRIAAIAALLSPESGIVDASALLESHRRRAHAHGAELALRTEVTAIDRERAAFRILTRTTGEPSAEPCSIRATHVINAAGLHATRIAALAGLPVESLGYTQHFCKGDYFQVSPRLTRAVQRLIYPLPVHAGLGIHLTHDLSGRLRAGPDAEYVPAPRHDIAPEKRHLFAQAVARYLPELTADDLTPDFAGVRPKLQGPGDDFADFVIEEATRHGLPGLVNLLGIESPGLTANEAIARRVVELLPH